MVEEARSNDPTVLQILSAHPRVARALPGGKPLEFKTGSWEREVLVGDPSVPDHGLVELMDNNPLVCADRMSVPSAAATLALIAIGPLGTAGLMVEEPVVQTNAPIDPQELEAFLRTSGSPFGVVADFEAADLGGVYAMTAHAVIRTPDDLDEIHDLYDERFGRSFFVRREEEAVWHVELVLGKPYAAYRLRISPDKPNSLLTIRAMADARGKCGAAQVVHAMNVMCGFEESLGLG